VRVVDAGVNDRHADVLTMQPRRALPRLRRADERHAFRIVEVIGADRFDFDDARSVAKALICSGVPRTLMPLMACWNCPSTVPPIL